MPGELDATQLVNEPGALADAVELSRDSVIEWMESQVSLTN